MSKTQSLKAKIDTTDELDLRSRSGIRTPHFVGEGETTSDDGNSPAAKAALV